MVLAVMQVDDDTLVALSKAKSLKGLNLAFCKAVTDRGVGSLAAITALQSLNLQGCGRGLPHIGASLGKLTALHQLHSLNLSSTYLTHACMQVRCVSPRPFQTPSYPSISAALLDSFLLAPHSRLQAGKMCPHSEIL